MGTVGIHSAEQEIINIKSVKSRNASHLQLPRNSHSFIKDQSLIMLSKERKALALTWRRIILKLEDNTAIIPLYHLATHYIQEIVPESVLKVPMTVIDMG